MEGIPSGTTAPSTPGSSPSTAGTSGPSTPNNPPTGIHGRRHRLLANPFASPDTDPDPGEPVAALAHVPYRTLALLRWRAFLCVLMAVLFATIGAELIYLCSSAVLSRFVLFPPFVNGDANMDKVLWSVPIGPFLMIAGYGTWYRYRWGRWLGMVSCGLLMYGCTIVEPMIIPRSIQAIPIVGFLVVYITAGPELFGPDFIPFADLHREHLRRKNARKRARAEGRPLPQ